MHSRRLHLVAIGAGLVIAAAMIPFLVSDWRALKATRNLSATVDDWKDGQRQALALLVIYAQTESPTEFSNFEAAIGRSLALRPVRLLLSAKNPDPNEIAQRLLLAGREPIEVAGFVETLERMLELQNFPTILRLWEHADAQIDGVLELAYHLRHAASGQRGPSVAEALLEIRSASGDLQTTSAELAKLLVDGEHRLRMKLIGRGVVASLLALAPGALLFAFTIRDRRRAKPQPLSLTGDPDLLSRSALGVWHRDLEGSTVFANSTLLALFGADGAATVGSRYEWIVTPESSARARHERERVLDGATSVYEIELGASSVATRRLLVASAPVRSHGGEIESTIEHYFDLGDEAGIAVSREVDGHHVLQQLPASVWTTDRDLRYTFVTGQPLPGVTPESGMPICDSYDSRTRPMAALRAHECALDGESGVYEHEIDGHIYRCLVWPLKDDRGRIDGTIGVGIDIAEHKSDQLRLEQLANRDPLTNLYNRRHFEEELTRALDASVRHDRGGVLLWCDLDHFKDINDSLGHSTGDLFLKRVADAFRVEVRRGEILARLGGDEFGVLLPDASMEDAAALARRLLESVRRETAAIKSRGLRTTASIGLVAFPEHGSTAEDLLTRADIAMYQAKREGRGRIEVFSYDDHLRPFLARVQIADQVRACLEQDRMELHLEPICNLRDRSVARYEALLRMPDEHGKLIAPESFLGICEDFGVMRDVDRWVIRKACELLRFFRDQAVNTPIEINLSGAAFGDESILGLIGREVREGDINPGSLIFEISEKAAVADLQRARAFIEELRRLGCQFAVDDFGVGFSSFGYLRHLPVRYLKIDGSFIRGLHQDLVNQNLVRAIVEMSRSLGVTPVAEFVEDQRIAEWLLAEGCLFGQGSYTGLARPVNEVLNQRATAVAARWRAVTKRRDVLNQTPVAAVGGVLGR
ncbi:MAG TPA: EAL domain-containing protein [Thermoanaerobaculia bacterium]|nr:EAL domain-containing protein [Thermoanaerobaculia bacterium]